ncbi:hypothetical protein NM688_g1543 [Phlebia brevispora]|uniref:Uncharacterized protein n=1 Tax=Phlebia brevispora TaxID=194682 RepID=A0ACC1TBH5_9APHY|nr:hypothetical protein NM688_g1543 [Phlebia brevispora]
MPTDNDTSGPNDDLADALRSVAKQLEAISGRISAGSIAETSQRKESTDKDNDDEASGCTAEAMEEELWETTRDTIKEQDQVDIDNWKDELNNLLVFAGLFSAVVTAFTVESYTWLQQDSGDATNTFLAHISLQISSFTTTPSFVNSSAPALPFQNVTSAFTPPAIAVPVNTLWVLSLTLSLLSAFFAIAVQQWLRQLRLPADIPARRAVELLALRADGLKTWQVPGIISFLPLLLQVAVVLFLIGLLILLRSLNATVAIVFGIVAVLGLMAFLVSTFIPLLSDRCPYRSPVVPTVLIVLQWLSYPICLLAVVGIFPFNAILRSPAGQAILQAEIIPFAVWDFFDDFDIWFHRKLLAYIKSFGQHMFVDVGQFWLQREYQQVLTLNDVKASKLRQSSVARVLLMCSLPSFARLFSCMRRFSSDEWRGVSRVMVMHSLDIFLPGSSFRGVVDYYGNVVPRAESYIRHWLSSRHSDLLLKAQEAHDWKQDDKLSGEDQDGLVLSSEVEKHGSQRYMQHVKHLFYICDNQTTNEDHCLTQEATTLLLILKAFNAGYAHKVDEARIVINFATRHGTRHAVRRRIWDSDAHRTLFISCTAVLVAMTHHPSDLQEEGRQLLSKVSNILCDGDWKRGHKENLQAFYTGHSEYLVHAFRPIPNIHTTLCRALVTLAKKGVLLRDPECPSVRLASTLREIYDGIDEEEINDARRSLSEFFWEIPYKGNLDRWKEEILGECMQALVHAECEARSTSLQLSPTLHQGSDPFTVEHPRLPSYGEDARADCTTDRESSVRKFI